MYFLSPYFLCEPDNRLLILFAIVIIIIPNSLVTNY